MIEQRISIIIGLWSEGFFSESEVISWADKSILEMDDDIYDPLIELSLKGPARCIKKPSYEFPDAKEFSFRERFAIRLTKLDLSKQEDIREFVKWAARNAMGEDLDIPEVQFGYQLDHYLDYDEIDPIVHFERNVHEYIESSKATVNSFLRQANA
jgi:hypothetical protein